MSGPEVVLDVPRSFYIAPSKLEAYVVAHRPEVSHVVSLDDRT